MVDFIETPRLVLFPYTLDGLSLFNRDLDAFEKEYVSQGYDNDRSIEETLDIGWELLRILPRSELKRIKDEDLDTYYEKKD